MSYQDHRRGAIAVVSALTVCLAACLEKETRSTAYVEEDGSVTWTILETAVRSSEREPGAARREQEAYLAEHLSGQTRLAAALVAIGGREARSELLRASAPFEARVSARFDSLMDLFGGYCAARGWPCNSEVVRSGAHTTWTLTLDAASLEAESGVTAEETLAPLDEALCGLRVSLATGRFVSARGFKLEGGGLAVLDAGDDGEGGEDGETFTLSLTWTARD